MSDRRYHATTGKPVEDNDVCICGHRSGDHDADPPFDDACGVDGCDCDGFELKSYPLEDRGGV
jgi:hypothetical protein